MKMSYYSLNTQELLQKVKDGYHNYDSSAKYYIENKEILKEKAKTKYRNLSEEEKEGKRSYGRKRYENMKEKTR